MKLTNRLKDALASIVGDQVPLDADALGSDHSFDRIVKVSERQDVLAEMRGLNQSDLLNLMFQSCQKAGNSARSLAELDETKNTKRALHDALLAAAEIVFQPWPAKCVIYIPLRRFPKIPTDTVNLSTSLSIVMLSETFFASPSTSYIPSDAANASIKIPALRVACSGYINNRSSSSAVVDGLSKVREFLYLGLAFGVIQKEFAGIIGRAMRPSNPYPEIICGQLEVASDVPWPISVNPALVQHAGDWKPSTFSLGLLEVDDPTETDNQIWYRRLIDHMSRIRPILDAETDDEDLTSMRVAIEWAFEAEIAEEASTSIIQSFVSLEALLSDPPKGDGKDNTAPGSITARLADRYAYLVGTTFTNRKSREDEFRRLYEMRGRILHGKTTRSTLAHRYADKEKLQRMVRNAIQAEANRYLNCTKKSGALTQLFNSR